MDGKIPIVAVVGPTASGKTALGVYIAKYFKSEIISADSMQIYKDMQIATAKPSLEEREGIPHHLMDLIDISDSFSVSEYVTLANKVIDDVRARGKLPIIVGGTGLYINSLIDNIKFSEEKNDLVFRQKLYEILDEQGVQALFDELMEIDSSYAKTLHPNNVKKIIRGLEIFHTTNIPMSEHLKESKSVPTRFNPCMIGLNYRNRDKLYERINQRVDSMVEQGLLDEAEKIIKSKNQKTSFQAIGYKELQKYFTGEQGLEESLDIIKRQSRRYAKRQLTWFRKDKRIHWIYVDEYDSIKTIYEQSVKIIVNQFFL